MVGPRGHRVSDKAYEEDQLMPGFGLAPIKTQGSSVTYDSTSQGVTSRYTHVAYGLGFIVTREAIADNQYKSKALRGTKGPGLLLPSDEGERRRQRLQPGVQLLLHRRRWLGPVRLHPLDDYRQPVERAQRVGRPVGSLA
jgi:hypothetical protein